MCWCLLNSLDQVNILNIYFNYYLKMISVMNNIIIIYIYVCVCVCVDFNQESPRFWAVTCILQ